MGRVGRLGRPSGAGGLSASTYGARQHRFALGHANLVLSHGRGAMQQGGKTKGTGEVGTDADTGMGQLGRRTSKLKAFSKLLMLAMTCGILCRVADQRSP